jgi:hypothetical protein
MKPPSIRITSRHASPITFPLDPELVAELRRVPEPGHEHRDSADLDVLAERVVRERRVREVAAGEALEDLAAARPLEAEVRHRVCELAHDDAGSLGLRREDLVVAVVRAAEPDRVR